MGIEYNEVIVKELVKGKVINNIENDFIKWIDIKYNNGFIREMGKIKLYFN